MNDKPVKINTPRGTRMIMIDMKGMIRRGYLHSIIPDPDYAEGTTSLEECVEKGIPLIVNLTYSKDSPIIIAEGHIYNTIIVEDC